MLNLSGFTNPVPRLTLFCDLGKSHQLDALPAIEDLDLLAKYWGLFCCLSMSFVDGCAPKSTGPQVSGSLVGGGENYNGVHGWVPEAKSRGSWGERDMHLLTRLWIDYDSW